MQPLLFPSVVSRLTVVARTPGCMIAAVMVVALGVVTPCLADLVARDNFDYATGEIGGQNGGEGWVGDWENFDNTDTSEVVTPTTALSYNAGGGYRTLGGGNALQLAKEQNIVTPVIRQFDELPSGETFYMRYLINLTTNTWDGDDFFVGFADYQEQSDNFAHANSPNVGLRAANSGPTDFFARPDTGSTMATSGESFVVQTTYLVVARFEDSSDSDGDYDLTSIWINPTFADAGTPDDTSNLDTNISFPMGAMEYVGWRFGSNLNASDVLLVDDLAITTSFEEAIGVPEPASVAMLAIGGGLLLARRKA